MAENRKKKNQQKLPWWLMPVLLLAVLAIWFGGGAGARLPVVIRFADLRIDHHSAEGAV